MSDQMNEYVGNNLSLFNFMRYVFGNETAAFDDAFDFADLFSIIADSFLTTFVLFFIASWILSICLDLSKKGGK